MNYRSIPSGVSVRFCSIRPCLAMGRLAAVSEHQPKTCASGIPVMKSWLCRPVWYAYPDTRLSCHLVNHSLPQPPTSTAYLVDEAISLLPINTHTNTRGVKAPGSFPALAVMKIFFPLRSRPHRHIKKVIYSHLVSDSAYFQH